MTEGDKMLDNITKIKEHMEELADLCGRSNNIGVISSLEEAYAHIMNVEYDLFGEVIYAGRQNK